MKRRIYQSPLGMSRSVLLLIVFVLIVFVASFFARSWVRSWQTGQTQQLLENRGSENLYPSKLVGLSPSNVETLFALGLGNKVVAVNRYSSYPPEATELPKICGMVDVDFEQLLILKPECVVMLDSQSSILPKFEELGIKTLSVTHDTVDGIKNSFSEIASVCGNQEKAAAIVVEIESHIAAVRKQVEGKEKPRVLVCIHHSTDVSEPEQIIACGSAGYHRELIEIAGGVNAYEGPIAFPKLSRENLININPDIIIDLVNAKVSVGRSRESLIKLWDVYGELDAVKNQNIVIADGAEHFLPGPRFLATLDVFAQGIHGVSVSRESTILKDFEEGVSQ